MARLLSGPYDPSLVRLVRGDPTDRTHIIATTEVSSAARHLLATIFDWDHGLYDGGANGEAQRKALARSILGAFGRRKYSEAKSLLGLFSSREDLSDAVRTVMTERLGLKDPADLNLEDGM